MWDCLPKVPASTRARNSIAEFQTLIKAGKQKQATDNAYELATYIAKRSGLTDLLKADTSIEGMGRLENINALLDGINAFVEDDTFTDTNTVPDKSLASYLQNIALLTDFDDKNKDGDFVTLMSVHSAKGLEFKSIFVVGLEENLFPSSMALDSKEGLDEERRLFYVAVTRAELFLTLSFANSRYRFGKMRFNQASRFLEEIPPIHMESTGYVRAKSGAEQATRGARVMGNFKKPQRGQSNRLMVDPATFKPNAADEIQVGMKILHMKFGEGKVLSIDGGKDNRVATIFFQGVENPERRIMLRFAKLQILS
jgi:DNA helicase-2/ATP-dependent DNA helicase PcrA